MKKLIINRSKWLRGEGTKNSKLLRGDGKMCCVGIYLSSCGMMPDELFNRNVAHDLNVLLPKEAEWLVVLGCGSQDAMCLYEVNDHQVGEEAYINSIIGKIENFDEAKREELVKERFAKHDIEVVFED